MAYTQDDLAAVKAAIASGAERIRFADGREVTYRNVAELMRAKALIEAELAALSLQTRPATRLVSFRRR